ncbi:MAG: sulfatase [Bacteroidales bacterium]|nr:sulfatase [Bacteroidales bacterium]
MSILQNIMKPRLSTPVGLGLAAALFGGCSPRQPEKPNILFIMSDDHAYQAISAYGHGLNSTPNIDRLAAEGIRFDQGYCTNSISAPSRAVILTGKFSHLNGLRDNSDVFDGSQVTLPKMLRPAGYQSAVIGKWHLKTDPEGFDFWRILIDQGPYYNPDLKDSTGVTRYEGYTTTIIGDQAIEWLDRRDPDKPFFLMVHHKAPHRRWCPEPKYFGLFEKQRFPVPETYFDDYSNRGRAAAEQEMSVIQDMTLHYDLKIFPREGDSLQGPDRSWDSELKRMTPEQRAAWESYYQPLSDRFYAAALTGSELALWKLQRYLEDYLAVIQSVDDQVGRLLNYLKENGLEENTLVVYTSDQGFYLGEHGWFDKRFMYEESFRTPVLMRWPGKIKAGSTSRALIQNLDFAPTFVEMAGLEPTETLQGESLLPVFTQSDSDGAAPPEWRKSIYYHYYEFPGSHAVKRHYGVYDGRYKLIHFYHDIDEWELYDLQADAQEMNNVYSDPAYAAILVDLQAELKRLQVQYQDTELAQ